MTFKELRTQYEINGLLFRDQFFGLPHYNSMADKVSIGTVEFDHDDWLSNGSAGKYVGNIRRKNDSYLKPCGFNQTLQLCQPMGQTVGSPKSPSDEVNAAIKSPTHYVIVKELAVFFKPAEGEKQKIEATQKEFVEKQGRFFFEELKARYNKLGENSKYQGEQFVNFILDKEPPLIESQLDDWLYWDETHRPIQFKRKLMVGANAPTLDKIRELYNSDAHEQTWFYSWVQPQILDEEYYDTAETLLCGILMFKEWLKEIQATSKSAEAGKKVDSKLTTALDSGEIGTVILHLESTVASVIHAPSNNKNENNEIKLKKWEGYFHSNLCSFLFGAEIPHKKEDPSLNGRSDIIIERVNYVYCFELKIDSDANIALQQVIDKGYLRPYFASGKKLIAIGLNFSTSKGSRGLESHKFEVVIPTTKKP